MGQDSSYVLKDLILLGNKTYTPKAFLLSEIIEKNYKDGYFEEGILDKDIQFKVEIECDEASNTHLYQIYSQGAIWGEDGKPITGLSMLIHNAYLNNDNTGEIRSSRICQDINGYLYEFLTFNGIKNLNETNFKPGGYFGPPMSTDSRYLFCADWSTRDDIEGKHKVTIQTNNPNVKAIAISFIPPIIWSSTLYTSKRIKINNEYINNFETTADIINSERTKSSDGINYCSRYIIVKIDGELKVFKSWIFDKNYLNELEYSIYLKGKIFGEMKSFTLDELIEENSFDGTFDDLKMPHFKLDLLFRQQWVTYNSGEVATSGAIIWDVNNNVLSNYELEFRYQTASLIQEVFHDEIELMRIIIMNDKLANNSSYYFSNNFGKNVAATHKYTTAGKVVSTLTLSVLGGVGKEMHSSIYFFSKYFKAFALDAISMYDYKYNGVNSIQSRHAGYLKSITHNNVLHEANSAVDWVDKYVVTINNVVYSARCIFTTTRSFLVYTDITNAKYLEIDPTLYIYYVITNEMIPHTIDECIEMDFKDRIFDGKYVYDITPITSSLFKISKTFTADEIGVNKIVLVDDTYKVIQTSRLGKNIATDNTYLYKINSSNVLEEGYLFSNAFIGEGILSKEASINFDLMTDNPNCTIYGIVAWLNYEEDDVHKNAGKLEINNKVIYNYTNSANFMANEFKTVDGDFLGSIYFYDKTNDIVKKAWVLIKEGVVDYSTFYLISTKKNQAFESNVQQILEDIRDDGYTDRDIITFDTFSVQILSGGAYGGAIYRVYPVINDEIYVGAKYTTSTASSGSVKVWIKPSGIPCRTKEDKLNFLNIAKNIDSRTSGITYNTAINSYVMGSDEIELTCTFKGKYSNGVYYQPAYIFGRTESSNSNTYYLGINQNSTRLNTFTISNWGDNIKNTYVQGLFVIPYNSTPTNGRCATKFNFKTYTSGDILTDNDISASSYRGWYISSENKTATEII